MRHSLATFVFILVLSKIDYLDSKPIKVVYTGQGCECHKHLPYQVNVPVQPQPPDMDCRSYGYKIERPPQARAQYSYSFDFIVEEPIKPTPKPVFSENLFATIDRIQMPKPDCLMEIASPCGIPAPEQRKPKPAPKRCQFDRTKVCTCGMCTSGNQIIAADYEDAADVPVSSCACGQCNPSNPQCRYVSSGIQSNRATRVGGRSKRDVSEPKKVNYIGSLYEYMKSLKATRDARKVKNTKSFQKSKIVKRDIKGEYDLLQKDQAALDLTIPEIIQYMPETLKPDFKRGKCNIGCKNCINGIPKERKENNSPSTTTNNDDNQQQLQKSDETGETTSNENTQNTPTQQYRLRPRFSGANYLKRSVNPYQYPQPCQPAVMPPPYIPSPLHLATLAENPGNPIWYEPRPLIDPNGRYVYDRLGHKYEVKNGSLKLVTPQRIDEVYLSTPATTPAADNSSGETVSIPTAQEKMNPQMFDYLKMDPEPILGVPKQNPSSHDLQYHSESIHGAPATHKHNSQMHSESIYTAPAMHHYNPSHDPQMDKVIRDIIYKHPDFIDASQHAPGSLVQTQDVQSYETMEFLKKLIRGRLNNWFGASEEEQSSHLQDLNRYSRETGTSVQFVPVVTVDKERLNRYRQEQAQISSQYF